MSQVLIVITQLLIVVNIFLINKRLDEMPKRMAWECKEVDESQKRITEFFERKYRDALIRLRVYEDALAAATDNQSKKSHGESGDID